MSGYSKALEWLYSTGPEEISGAVAPFFGKIPTSQIVDAITRYKSQDTWSSTPDLNEPEYQGLQDILLSAGMVIERQPYIKVDHQILSITLKNIFESYVLTINHKDVVSLAQDHSRIIFI